MIPIPKAAIMAKRIIINSFLLYKYLKKKSKFFFEFGFLFV